MLRKACSLSALPISAFLPVISILSVCALSLSLVACSNKNLKGSITPATPTIPKGQKPEPQVSSVNDEFSLAFNELLWARQNASLSLNPPQQATTEGCVDRVPHKTNQFLSETFTCRRLSDDSDAQGDRRYELRGNQIYTMTPGYFQTSGVFALKTYGLSKDKDGKDVEALVSQGALTRGLQMLSPSALAGLTERRETSLVSSIFQSKVTGDYKGDVAVDSKRQPELWQSMVAGSFSASTAEPIALTVGSKISFNYLPEAEPEVKRSAVVLELTATSPIQFALNSGCLRPLGNFNWTLSQGGITKTGTLVSTSTGYHRLEEASEHLWGKRCLER